MAKINNVYDIGKAFEAIEKELMASMIRNMKRHKVDEADEKKQWSMWQTEMLKSLEKYKHDNKKKYGQKFKDINAQIGALISAANAEGQMEQEKKILEAIRNGFPAKRVTKGGTAEFFKLNDRKLEALIKATTNDMQKAETAVLRMADDQYRKIIYNAQVYVNTGAGTYEKAVDMASNDFLKVGLNCVQYANGARHTIADYADMAIRTASKRAYLQGEGVKRQEWGVHTVIINKRGSGCPCPLCVPFVGKVMIDDVWSGGTKKEAQETGYRLMSNAIDAGLYHPRCRDSHTTYFPGISTPPDRKFTRKELKEIETKNKQEARQQYAERQAEKFGRLADFSLDPENQQRYEQKREEYIAKAKESDIINTENAGEVIEVHTVGKIDRDIYKCVTDDIMTDEVIITDERIMHIKERHPNDYERFCSYIPEVIKNPDYIIKANKPDTATILKEIVEDEKKFQLVLRLKTSKDKPGFKNSIITFLNINERTWNKYLRNKEILYKKE